VHFEHSENMNIALVWSLALQPIPRVGLRHSSKSLDLCDEMQAAETASH